METPRIFSADPAKNARNLALRGIDMVEGAKAFEWQTAVGAMDDRKDYGELRIVASGFIGARLHVIVFTMRGATCHVISLRKANEREVRAYVRNIEEME